ncbi:MAG: hypothetical protein ACK4VY_11315 [Brevundimonas sp.]
MKPVRILVIAIYIAFACMWVFDIWIIRHLVPWYVVAIGAFAVTFLFPKSTVPAEDGDVTFIRWFIDHFAVVGFVVGMTLFGISSGLVFRTPFELNLFAKISLAVAFVAIACNLVPRHWFKARSRRKITKLYD